MARNYGEYIYLIGYAITKDELNQNIKTPVKTGVFANKQSIGQREFFSAGENGFKAEYTFKIATVDYDGQAVIEYNGKLYDIYRTHEVGDRIVLYVHYKVGVKQ